LLARIAGFLIYYLLPLSLLSFNLTLFFDIFFALLLGVSKYSPSCHPLHRSSGSRGSQMLFGLILLSLNFEHMVERFVVRPNFKQLSSTCKRVFFRCSSSCSGRAPPSRPLC
jgi:hypothetical protein